MERPINQWVTADAVQADWLVDDESVGVMNEVGEDCIGVVRDDQIRDIESTAVIHPFKIYCLMFFKQGGD